MENNNNNVEVINNNINNINNNINIINIKEQVLLILSLRNNLASHTL